MFGKKQGRNFHSYNINQSPDFNAQTQFQRNLQQQEFQQQRYFNSPLIHSQIHPLLKNMKAVKKPQEEFPKNIEPSEETHKNVSATTKALHQMEVELEEMEKQKWKKTGKIATALRRKKLNQRLSRLLAPKSALILLHELKPGCIFKVQELPGSIRPCFSAQVEHKDVILGTGQGSSKSQAKNSAAEKAIKEIITRTMTQTPKLKEDTKTEELNEESMEDSPENLPWAGIASFAIYKMFSEWQSDGTDLTLARPSKNKVKPPNIPNGPVKKELPPNAVDLHPAVVLNIMYPGLIAVEIEREDGPRCRVKMGYSIDERMFTGVGGNKKDAKKEAAKAVLKDLYGLTYPD